MEPQLRKELRDIGLALILFLVGLGYSVSGFPANIVVACAIWVAAWLFLTHLFFILEWTEGCPKDVKVTIWAALTFLVVILLWSPVQQQYAKEHLPPQPEVRTPPMPSTAPALSAAPTAPITRTYLLLDGNIRFPQDVAADGHSVLPERNFHIGEQLFFNYSYKAMGPNPIQVFAGSRWVYLEPDAGDDIQQEIIKNFKERAAREWEANPRFAENYTLMHAGDRGQWNTAFSYTEEGKKRMVMQKDLDDLRTGAVRVLVVIQIPYKDNAEWHYLRTCQYLVPPAMVPAVWHFCDHFTNSD
jgi:hypothetical protein